MCFPIPRLSHPAITCFVVFFVCQTAEVKASLYADIETSLGSFTIDLDYTNTPITVGNFIGLASGELPWVDSQTGQVREKRPYFDGIIFHRVIAGFMNQGGDPTGTGSGGPGYRFKDELSTSDFSSPYRVAMANSGPQSNGSQFFITAPASSRPTHLNGVHTVFGYIPGDDGTGGIIDGSRNVVDAINAVSTTNELPNTPVEILSVTIRRTDASAEAFVIPTADLPQIEPIAVDFVNGNSGQDLAFPQAPGTTFHVGVSGDLTNWETASRYISSDESAQSSYTPLQAGADASKQFYTPVQITTAHAVTFPNSMANRTLTAEVGTAGSIEFIFNTDGATGTYEFYSSSGGSPIIGTFLLYNASTFPYIADADGGRLFLELDGINPYIWAFNRLGQDSWDATQIMGRHNLTAYFIAGGSSSFPGTFSLSR